MSEEKVKLTSKVAGESILELSKLYEIRNLAEKEINNHKEIIGSHSNVEFEIAKGETLELNEPKMDTLNPDEYYSEKIQDIILRKSGQQAVLFIRRGKEE